MLPNSRLLRRFVAAAFASTLACASSVAAASAADDKVAAALGAAPGLEESLGITGSEHVNRLDSRPREK